MNWKSLIALGLIFFALAGYVYYYEYKAGAKRESDEETGRKLYSFESGDLDEIWIDSNRRASTHVRKQQDGQWRLAKPMDALADSFAVDSITRSLAEVASSRDFPADDPNKKEFRLDSPAWKVRFSVRGKGQQEIWLGATDFSGRNVYAWQKGSPNIVIISESLLSAVDKEPSQLRDRQLLAFDSSKVQRILISEGAKSLEIVRSGDNWKISSAKPLDADSGEVSSVLSTLSSARVVDFVSEKPTDWKRYGLDPPARKIEVFLGAEGTRVLDVGTAKEENFYARVAGLPQLVTITKDTLAKIVADPAAFRDKSIAHWNSSEVESFRFKNQQGSFWLEKTKEFEWRFKEPAGLKGKEAQYYRVVTPVETLRAAEIVDAPGPLNTYGLAEPAVEAEVLLKGKPSVKVWIGKDSKSQNWARSSQSQSIFRLDSDVLSQLSFKADEIVQK